MQAMRASALRNFNSVYRVGNSVREGFYTCTRINDVLEENKYIVKVIPRTARATGTCYWK